jgi:hypothetical protein
MDSTDLLEYKEIVAFQDWARPIDFIRDSDQRLLYQKEWDNPIDQATFEKMKQK